jgi:arylsulfatase
MAGKWHLGHEPELYPSERGFDRSFVLLGGGASHWPDMIGLMEAGTPAKYAMNGETLDKLPGDFYSSRSYADFLIESIRENRDDGKPFLAYLAFTSPHDPVHVPEPWLSKYRGRYADGFEVLKKQRASKAKQLGLVPEEAPTPNPTADQELIKPWGSLTDEQRTVNARSMEVYAGMISNMDYHLGRVVDALKDMGEYDNTLIIFLSDNGANPYFSEDYPDPRQGEWLTQFDNSAVNLGNPNSNYAYGIGWAAASAGPLGLAKMTVGEGGIRTPLLMSGPGIKSGHRVESFTYVWDIMPTILDLAGISHPEKYEGRPVERMRGRSLKGVLNATTQAVYGTDEFIAGELQNGKWVRQGNYKAVSVAAPYGGGEWHLYNLAEDPGETKDLSSDRSSRGPASGSSAESAG